MVAIPILEIYTCMCLRFQDMEYLNSTFDSPNVAELVSKIWNHSQFYKCV